MFNSSISWHDLLFMLRGAGVTLAITFWAVAGGTLLGVGFGLLRAGAPGWLNLALGGVLDIFRSVPLLIQLVLANAFQPIIGLSWPPFTIACIVLAVYASAYCAEIVRAGVLAVPVATRRAARSLGLSWTQDLTAIVFPIALRVALPSWINLALGLMKDSALVLWIGIIELLRSSQIIVTRTQQPLLVLSIAGAIYFAISFPVARLGAALERRWRDHD
jgi:His/Glu/Gln/Arg/opine family amino acid ABC transporter permease subunit